MPDPRHQGQSGTKYETDKYVFINSLFTIFAGQILFFVFSADSC